MKTILLTGGTGFLGSHLLKTLAEKNYQIVVLKRSFSDVKRIKDVLLQKNILTYDLDKTALKAIFEQCCPDIVIHCATEYGRKPESVDAVIDCNIIFPLKLLELCVKYQVKAFVNTDSYFNKEGLSYPYLLNYSLSKKSLKLWLKEYSKKLSIFNLILEHVYGEDDNADKFVMQMIHAIAEKKENIVDLSLGTQKRDFVYVEDVCGVYLKVLQNLPSDKKLDYTEIEVGTGRAVSIRTFVEKIKEISNSPTILNFGKLPTREQEILFSSAKHNNFSLEKYCTIEQGIEKILKIKGII